MLERRQYISNRKHETNYRFRFWRVEHCPSKCPDDQPPFMCIPLPACRPETAAPFSRKHERATGRPAGSFNHQAILFDFSLAPGFLEHVSCDPVLDRPGRMHLFQLTPDRGLFRIKRNAIERSREMEIAARNHFPLFLTAIHEISTRASIGSRAT